MALKISFSLPRLMIQNTMAQIFHNEFCFGDKFFTSYVMAVLNF